MHFATQIINFKKIGSKLWPWQCPRARIQNGRRDVIKYANELKMKRAQLDHCGTNLGKFGWNRPSSFAKRLSTDTNTDTHSSNPRKVGPLSKTRKLGPQTHSHSPYWYLLTDYFNTLKLHCKRLMYFGLTCLAIGPEQCQFAKNGALKVGPCVCKTPEK